MQATISYTHNRSLITAAIIGASGYSGAELLRLLTSRNDVQVAHMTAASSAGKRIDDLYPIFSGQVDLAYEPSDTLRFEGIDIAFIALPSGEAMNIVPRLLPSVERIIDLGGDFRLSSPSLYKQFYKHEHTSPSLLPKAVYGLPEINKNLISCATLVANPGCYPTSIILSLMPALIHQMISPQGIVINSLSGVSGAGRTSSIDFSFTEVNENIRAYKIGSHQHIPEIQSVLEKTSGTSVSFSFVPHVVPITRGIYSTICADLDVSITEKEVRDAYREFYRDAPFVRVKEHIPQIRDVVRTNYCDIGMSIEPHSKQLILVSVIDNLVKGAAGQAIQNMNIMFGLPQEHGLQ